MRRFYGLQQKPQGPATCPKLVSHCKGKKSRSPVSHAPSVGLPSTMSHRHLLAAMEGEVCSKCFKAISGTTVRAFGKAWHDFCFTCGKCKYPIRDSKYAAEHDIPYHGDCLALLRGEVCTQCLKPITGTVTTALGKKWHPDCFTCARCRLPILTAQFSAKDGLAYHIHCHLPLDVPLRPQVDPMPFSTPTNPLRMTASPPSRGASPPSMPLLGYEKMVELDFCHGCYQLIKEGVTTTALGKTWHPSCFKCVKCMRPIGEDKFRTEGGLPYHVNCKLADPIRICRGCYQTIDGIDITEAMGELWHPECFKCAVCGFRIHGREFARQGILPVHLHCKKVPASPVRPSGYPRNTSVSPARIGHSHNAPGGYTSSASSWDPAPNDTGRPAQDISIDRAPLSSALQEPTSSNTTVLSPSFPPVGSDPGLQGLSPVLEPQPSPPAAPQPQSSMCRRCDQPITGTMCQAGSFCYHQSCFVCGNCGLPVLDAEFMSGLHPFHNHCIESLKKGTNTVTTVPG